MIEAYITINLSNGDNIKYVRDVVNDSAGVGEKYYRYEGPGYQELGLNQVSDYDESGLNTNTTYYFTINIDGGGQRAEDPGDQWIRHSIRRPAG